MISGITVEMLEQLDHYCDIQAYFKKNEVLELSYMEEIFLKFLLLNYGFENNMFSIVDDSKEPKFVILNLGNLIYFTKNNYKKHYIKINEKLGGDIQTCESAHIIKIIPQYKINQNEKNKFYIVDFVFVCSKYDTLELNFYKNNKVFNVFVELDGHEFHEKTPEQVSYKNKRDNFLNLKGFVYHINYKDFKKDIENCYQNLCSYINKLAKYKI